VRDRPGEAERPRGQRVHVDRVAVAGHGRVAAPEVAGEAPLLGLARLARRLQLLLLLGAGGVSGRRAGLAGRALPGAGRALPGGGRRGVAAQHRAALAPHELALDARLADQREHPPARVGAQRRGAHLQLQALAGVDRALLGDRVGDVHEADGREREAPVGHQREVQGEGEDVGVARR
jgi:hypothetical protein